MRGRKPTPTQLQIARGDPRKRGVHKLDAKLAAERKAVRGLGECPAHLNGLAREQYERWKEDLEMMDLDNRPDAPALEGAAVQYARAVEADQMVKKYGLMVADVTTAADGSKTTRMKTNPAIAVSNAAWGHARGFMSEFGLTPVARTRLPINERAKSHMEDLMAILNKPRKNRRPPPPLLSPPVQ